MKKFRKLYYRPQRGDGKAVDDLIAFHTRLWNLKAPEKLICSHEELWTPDENGYFFERGTNPLGENYFQFFGYCWTSTMGQIGGKNREGSGVVCRSASEVLKHPERWFWGEYEISDFRHDMMIALMQDEVRYNKGYDKLMIANFFLPLGIGDDEKWICSEFSNHFGIIGLRGSENPMYEEIAEVLNDKMSPYRSAWTEYKCGVKFYNLDGSLVIK